MVTGFVFSFVFSKFSEFGKSDWKQKKQKKFHFVLKLFKQLNRLSAHLLNHECEEGKEKSLFEVERANDKCGERRKKITQIFIYMCILKEWWEFLCTIVVCVLVSVCVRSETVKHWMSMDLLNANKDRMRNSQSIHSIQSNGIQYNTSK